MKPPPKPIPEDKPLPFTPEEYRAFKVSESLAERARIDRLRLEAEERRIQERKGKQF